MTKKILLGGVLVWLLAAAAGPNVVSAEVDSLASPTPRPTERITAPVISGINPDAVLSEGSVGETHPSGSFLPGTILVPAPVDPPAFVELESQSGSKESLPKTLTGDFEDVNCGPAALALAMEFLDPAGQDSRPTTNQLIDFMSLRGLMYDWGTGVEELAYAAREFGYEGSIPFQGWSFEQLVEILKQGKPVVIPLGTNGENRPGHFVTLSNISKDGKWITYYDPLKGELNLSREEFLSLWKRQGNSGMIPRKGLSPLAADPMLPWMGLFGAISALALTLNQSAGWKESRVFAGLRKKLDNPRRKGIGSGPLPPIEPEVVRVPRFETKTVYRGIKTVNVEIPEYETRKVKVGIRGIRKEVPQYETRRVQVGVETVAKRVPVYTTKKVQTGTRLVKKEIPVTRYKIKKEKVWKKYTKRVPVYRNLGSKRFVIGYKNETRWKRIQVTRKVPYQTTKTIKVQVPVYENRKVISGYKVVTEKAPKFEQKRILVGHKIVNETVPVFEDQQVQVGTKTVQRQMPVYETVRVIAGYDEIPVHQQKLDTVEQKMKSICEDDELRDLVGERDFEVTDVVYLKGGPGAGFGMEKVENNWSGFYGGGGGGSTPWMLLLKLASRALVWVRDCTNILERLGAKPDAQAIMMYSEVELVKKMDEIIIMNKGNEKLYIHSIIIEIDKGDNARINELAELYPFTSDTRLDNRFIEPGNYRSFVVSPHFDIAQDVQSIMYIQISTQSKRSGFIIHEFEKQEN